MTEGILSELIDAFVKIFMGVVSVILAVIAFKSVSEARKEIKAGDEATGVKLDEAKTVIDEMAEEVSTVHSFLNSGLLKALEKILEQAKGKSLHVRSESPVSDRDVKEADEEVDRAQKNLDDHNVLQSNVDAAAAERADNRGDRAEDRQTESRQPHKDDAP